MTEKPDYNWFNKVDGQNDVLAEDVNTLAAMAQSGIVLGYEANQRLDELPSGGADIDESNLVHKTGDEEISGVKTFKNGIKTNGVLPIDNEIILSGKIITVNNNEDESEFTANLGYTEIYGDSGIVTRAKGTISAGSDRDVELFGENVNLSGEKISLDANVVSVNGKEFEEIIDSKDLKFQKFEEFDFTVIEVGSTICRTLEVGQSTFETWQNNLYIGDIDKVLVNEKEIALKEDIVSAINAAIYDSWEAAV